METNVGARRRAGGRSEALPAGVHLVGSVPLAGPEEVFRAVGAALGDRLRRIPDGETGPRSDFIVWQYPVLSALPQFEVGPPGPGDHRALPRLRLRAGESVDAVRLGSLGYAQAAIASYRVFARCKREGVVPAGCRFQVSLPAPLAPIGAFVAPEDQAAIEPVYEARMLLELDEILAAIPPEQLAIQWDTGVEPGILERLLRLSRRVPREVELGFHLCDAEARRARPDAPPATERQVQVANALATSLDRPVTWVHLPLPSDPAHVAHLGEFRLRPETELYLGLVDPAGGEEGTLRRIRAARRAVADFGVAAECGLGRLAPQAIPALLDLHRRVSTPAASPPAARAFAWPPGFVRVPDEEWTRRPVDSFGLAYDTVENHGWYRNLDPTVEDLARLLRDGDVLVDYSGGTGILLDRLKLRVFDRQVGMLIADSSGKFLRVALDRFRDDPLVGLRLLRYLKEERRLQHLDEVLGAPLVERGVDVIVSTNAIHLYYELPDTLASWRRSLRPGGMALVNSGNIRNPRARPNEWILDETVWVINEVAERLVRTDPRYAPYRDALDDEARLGAHHAHRDRVFLAPRPLQYYLDAFEAAGLPVEDVREETIEAGVDDWFELMSAYHDAVLGWVGGTERVDGRPPTDEAVRDRLDLIRHTMDVLFGERREFRACWTYLRCRR